MKRLPQYVVVLLLKPKHKLFYILSWSYFLEHKIKKECKD